VVGPLTTIEYEFRAECYEKSLCEEAGIDLEGMNTQQKMAAIRRYCEDRYEQLMEVVYSLC
jgi:aldehyde:ferredoxin oxidoreductase